MSQITNTVFRAYDIRGDYPLQINEDFAYLLGRAIVVFLKSEQIVVGRDCRSSSKQLADALMRGITEQGANVFDAGLCSTPLINFASKEHDAIIVTASHLSANKNGFKIFKKGARPIGEDDGLLQIKKIFETNKFSEPTSCGEIIRVDLMRKYVQHVLSFVKNPTKLKIVVDAGNGVAGYVLPYIFAGLPCELVRLFFDINGNFPNRSPNPIKNGALTKLCEIVVRENADFGVAYDIDCDRIVFVDERGEIIKSDILLALLAKSLLDRKKECVVYDLTCSKVVPETIQARKSTPVISRVGHSFIQEMMKKNNALFGGERSGHYFFRDNFFGDSGDITLMVIISLLSQTNKKISELVGPLKKYYNDQEVFQTQNKQKLIKVIEDAFKTAKIFRLDGVSCEFSDWWFNVRPSNTEPEIRITVEAKNKALFETKMKEMIHVIKKSV